MGSGGCNVYNLMGKVICLDILKTPRYILAKTGILFVKDITALDVFKIALNFLFDIGVISLILLNIRNALRANNMKLTNWMVCLLFPMINYSAKRLTLLINKKCLISLLDDLSSDVFNNHNEKLNRHIQVVNIISRIIFRYCALTMTASLTVYCVLPFVINIKLMIPAPFATGRFDIVYKLLHLMMAFYLSVNTTCFDSFYMTMQGVGLAQLNILEERLTNLLDDVRESMKLNVNIYGNVNVLTESILRECIVLHGMIIGFTKKLNVLLSFPLFIQYTCGCFIICNTVLQLTIMRDTDTSHLIGISGYSSVVLVQMAAYHWLANEIIFKSNKIVQSCYLSNWYEMNVKCQKNFILLMERAQRPLVIRVYNLIHISLESLAVVVRWSYSVFALIRARYS